MKNTDYDKLKQCHSFVQDRIAFVPEVALVLGSGLGDFANEITIETTLAYSDIPGFPVSTVSGHEGRFLFGYVNQVPVVAMQGRVHYYEGYTMPDVVLPIRLMQLMGAKTLFLTNAAGGVNPDLMPGDFMMITDQISSFVPSPLIGMNMEILGTRFPDMSKIYDPDLQMLMKNCADTLGIKLKQGIYLQFTGPNYESPAEVRLAGKLGADAVGMSTAVEAIAANHMGMKICGISFISNKGCGLSETPLCHEEVKAAADAAAPHFKRLVSRIITRIGQHGEE